MRSRCKYTDLGNAAEIEVAPHAEAAVRALLPVVDLALLAQELLQGRRVAIRQAVSRHHVLHGTQLLEDNISCWNTLNPPVSYAT